MNGIVYLEGQPVYTDVNQEPMDKNSEELLWQAASKVGLRTKLALSTKRDQARNQIFDMRSSISDSQKLRAKIDSIAEKSRQSEAAFAASCSLYSAGKNSNSIAGQKLVEEIQSSRVAFTPFAPKAKKAPLKNFEEMFGLSSIEAPRDVKDFEEMFEMRSERPPIDDSREVKESSDDFSSGAGITPVARFLHTPGLTYALNKGKEVVEAVCKSHPSLQKVCQSIKSHLPESMQAKRPRALVVTASADHNGALGLSWDDMGGVQGLLELEKSHDVEYRKVSSLTDFCKVIDQSAKDGDPIECLIINAHGNQKKISLSQTEGIYIHDDLSCLRNLSSKVTIVINACKAALGGKEEEQNFANFVAREAPKSARVFSATDTTSYLKVVNGDPIEFELWNSDLSPLNIFKGKAPISCKDVTYKIDKGEGTRDEIRTEVTKSLPRFKPQPIEEARLVQDLMHDVNILALPFKVVNQAIQKGCTLHPATEITCGAVAQTVRGVARKIPALVQAKRAIDSLKVKFEDAYLVKYGIPKEETRHFFNSVESLGLAFSGSIAGNALQKTTAILHHKIKQQQRASMIAREKLSTEPFVRNEGLKTITLSNSSSSGTMQYFYSLRQDGALRIFIHHLGADIPKNSQGLFLKAMGEIKRLVKEHKAPLVQLQFLAANKHLLKIIEKKSLRLGQLKTYVHEFGEHCLADTFLLVDKIRPVKEIPFLPHAGATGSVSLVKEENK